MAKLPRVTAKIFASNAASEDIGQFGSALSGTKVTTGDISEIQALAAYETGWRAAVISDRNYPTLQEMNGVQKTFSQQIAYLLQQGVPEWDSATTYYANNFCAKNGKLYISKTDENLNNDPENDSTNWEEFTMGGSGSGNEVGDIIWRLLPSNDAGKHLLDGALIDGSGSYSRFVDYIADLYANSSKISNVTKIGSLTDNNEVLSGFSTSNYALLPMAINVSTYNWEFVVKINTPDVTTLQTFIGGVNQEYAPFELQLENGRLKLWLDEAPTAAGNFANGVLSDTTFNINIDYWIKTVFNGTTYIVSYSTDGINYIDTISVTSSKVIFSDYLAFGLDKYANNTIYSGSIDLKESYININGQRWWTGTQPAWAINEATWQATVAQYGACGKFVYDSTNNTVRLPKVTGIVEGTIDATALGDLIEAGLPSHNHKLVNNSLSNTSLGQDSYLSYRSDFGGGDYKYNLCGAYTSPTLGVSGEANNSIYGKSNTVQPQTIKGYYYIVVATSTKTDIQVDIDEIATDLNGKADTDLLNVPTSRGILIDKSDPSILPRWYRVYADGWCEQGGIINSVSANTYTAATVALLKPYTNTNYLVMLTQWDNNQTLGIDAATNGQSVHSKALNSFVISAYSWTYGRMWQASGYIR